MLSRIVKIVTLLILTVALTMLAYKIYETQKIINSPLINDGTAIIIEVPPNSTATAVLHHLKERGLIRSEYVLLQYIKWKNIARQFKAGLYEIKPGETAIDLINKMVTGKVLLQSITIVEGSTLEQLKIQLKHASYLYFNNEDLEAIAGQYQSPEGLLLADTYYYDAGTNAKKLLKLANTNLVNFLAQAWLHRSDNLPYKNPYELLIVASILEKEASLPQEKRIIAGVIINRLNKRMPLQMDPTVIYALGSNYQGKLRHADLSIDSPYNTYKHYGLPPTPIAMVGRDAILAAAQPQFNSFLYYVAKGDGSHYFSKNYQEQQRAINRYLHKRQK